jgi:uncharacterized linocin/CFP29 family protein
MNHLRRELAPISDEAWQAVDDEARGRLTTQLAARQVVDFLGPNGWSHSSTDLGRTESIAAPSEGLVAAQRRVLPLLELRAEFKVSRVELDDIDRGATNTNFDELDEAVRQIAVGENFTVFHGHAAAGIRGVTETSSHKPMTFGADTERYPNTVAEAVDRIRQSGIAGPYALVLSPGIYTRIVQTAEHGGHLLFDHLRRILDGPLVWAPGVECGVVLSLRGGDFVFDCGEDLSIGYLDHDAEVVRLYLEESFSFRVDEPDASLQLRPAK